MTAARLHAPQTFSSFLVILARELRSHTRNPLVWGLVLFAGLLSAASAHMAAEDFKARVAAHAELAAGRDRERARAGGQVTGRVLEPGFRVIRAPDPLSTLVSGLDPVLPDFWDFGPAGRRSARLSVSMPVPIDLEFVIRVVLGLLAVMLVLESVGEERSNGTLLALLGQSLRSSLVMMVKLSAGAVTLAGAVATSVALTVLGVYMTGISIDREFLVSAMLVGIAGWIYLLTYFSIGAFIAGLVTSFHAALATIIVIWLLGGVVALPVAQLVARVVSPVPPDSLLEAQRERLARERIERAQMQMGDQYLATRAAGAVWTPLNADPASDLDAVDRLQPIWNRHIERLRAELDAIQSRASVGAARQARIARSLSVLSPGAQFTGAAMNLAGTGEASAACWDRATAAYTRQLAQQLFDDPPRLTMLVPKTSDAGDEPRWVVALSRRPLPTFDTLPVFEAPAPRGILERFSDALVYLIPLLLYGIGFAAAGTLAFTRIKF